MAPGRAKKVSLARRCFVMPTAKAVDASRAASMVYTSTMNSSRENWECGAEQPDEQVIRFRTSIGLSPLGKTKTTTHTSSAKHNNPVVIDSLVTPRAMALAPNLPFRSALLGLLKRCTDLEWRFSR